MKTTITIRTGIDHGLGNESAKGGDDTQIENVLGNTIIVILVADNVCLSAKGTHGIDGRCCYHFELLEYRFRRMIIITIVVVVVVFVADQL